MSVEMGLFHVIENEAEKIQKSCRILPLVPKLWLGNALAPKLCFAIHIKNNFTHKSRLVV